MTSRDQRDGIYYLESAVCKKNITHAHNFPVLPTIFQNINYDVLENCGQYWKIVGMGNTVILGKMAQHARLLALLMAKLKGKSKSVSNMALGQWIELQHIQRSMF